MRTVLTVLCLCLALAVVGCKKETSTAPAGAPPLDVSFADSDWTGGKIPGGQQCNKFGGNGATPALQVGNISAQADAIVVEYSDRDSRKMDRGGHGKIGYRIDSGTSSVTVPSVPGHTFELPEGFFIVAPHRNPAWDKAGAYMPPCSGGKGNRYYATVKAVQCETPECEDFSTLQQEVIQLGVY